MGKIDAESGNGSSFDLDPSDKLWKGRINSTVMMTLMLLLLMMAMRIIIISTQATRSGKRDIDDEYDIMSEVFFDLIIGPKI